MGRNWRKALTHVDHYLFPEPFATIQKNKMSEIALQIFGILHCEYTDCSFFEFARGCKAFGFVSYLLSFPNAQKNAHVQTSMKQSEQVTLAAKLYFGYELFCFADFHF